MKDYSRVLFSILWLVATTAMVALGFLTLLTWGDYWYYFLASIGLWGIATLGTIISAL